MSCKISALLVLALAVSWSQAINIDDFGAKPDDASYKTAINNGIAFNKAVIAANASATDRTVYVSQGKNYTVIAGGLVDNLENITVQFDGTFNAWAGNDVDWPNDDQGVALPLIYFSNTKGLIFRGTGRIEGNGYIWWWTAFLTGIDNRPVLFRIATSIDTLVEDITLTNAPEYHMDFFDAANLTIQNLVIRVDVNDDDVPHSLPVFPLNTDGIDVSGRDIVIRNLTVINFDDAVAVKPLHRNQGKYSNCTENLLIEDCYVKYGVGMSIGSVPPNPGVACIRNVTIRNIRFDKPFKAIYIKPNPPEDGTGLIDQITYENIEINDALWWAVYIGTQQEQQPYQNGTGCSFFFPLKGSTCPTDPLVTISNITLRNVNIYGGIFSPGIMICNETNPCTNLIFDNVNVYNASNFPITDGYLCENFSGYARKSNVVPSCLKNLDLEEEEKRMKK